MQREMARARRHGHPLTVVQIGLRPGAVPMNVVESLRVTDIALHSGDVLYVWCPDTPRDAGRDVLRRLLEHNGALVDRSRSAVATFPDDGLTFDGLYDSLIEFSLTAVTSAREARPLRTRAYRVVKRTAELLFILITTPVTVLVLAACALAIKVDSPGPVFYRQQRTGRDGRRFDMIKLRTMVQNADALKHTLRDRNMIGGPDFKVRDDPRITRVGRVLRKSSLDELPQLWNVVRGEMALIGPRPTSFDPETYDLWHTERLEVTPGMTGLWQVTERNSASFDERLRLDIYYMTHESLGLDARIIVRTVRSVFTRSGM